MLKFGNVFRGHFDLAGYWLVYREKEINMEFLCKWFGHRMYHNTNNLCAPCVCKRCGSKGKGVVWPKNKG